MAQKSGSDAFDLGTDNVIQLTGSGLRVVRSGSTVQNADLTTYQLLRFATWVLAHEEIKNRVPYLWLGLEIGYEQIVNGGDSLRLRLLERKAALEQQFRISLPERSNRFLFRNRINRGSVICAKGLGTEQPQQYHFRLNDDPSQIPELSWELAAEFAALILASYVALDVNGDLWISWLPIRPMEHWQGTGLADGIDGKIPPAFAAGIEFAEQEDLALLGALLGMAVPLHDLLRHLVTGVPRDSFSSAVASELINSGATTDRLIRALEDDDIEPMDVRFSGMISLAKAQDQLRQKEFLTCSLQATLLSQVEALAKRREREIVASRKNIDADRERLRTETAAFASRRQELALQLEQLQRQIAESEEIRTAAIQEREQAQTESAQLEAQRQALAADVAKVERLEQITERAQFATEQLYEAIAKGGDALLKLFQEKPEMARLFAGLFTGKK